MKLLVAVLLWLGFCGSSTEAWDDDFMTKKLTKFLVDHSKAVMYIVCDGCFDEDVNQMMKGIQEISVKPQVVIKDFKGFQVRKGDFNRVLLTIMVMKEMDERVFEIADAVLLGRHFYVGLVALQQPLNDLKKLELILRRLYQSKFFNTDVTYFNDSSNRNEVIGYHYYPKFALKNKTSYIGNKYTYLGHFFHPLDLKGFKILTPLKQDIPHVIKFRNKQGQQLNRGVAYDIMASFTEATNSSLGDVRFGNADTDIDEDDINEIVNMADILEMVRNNSVDMAVHAYALFNAEGNLDKGYPILVCRWCLMVPIFNKISKYGFPMIPFEIPVWISMLISFLLINLFQYLWFSWKEFSLDNLVLRNFCQLFGISPPRPKTHSNSTSFLFNFCIFFASFFLTACYTSVLGSYLTFSYSTKEINSIAELVKMKLPVMIIDYEYEFLKCHNPSLPEDFEQLLRIVNSSEFFQYQAALNSSFAYFVTEDKWHFLDKQQKYLDYPIFRFSSICFGAFHLSYPMQMDYPLWRAIEYFLYRIHSSGLYFYYETWAYHYALRSGLLKALSDGETYQIITFEHMLIVFMVWSGGLIIASIAFIYELLSYHIKVRST